MTRGDRQRLDDVEAACLAIHAHLERGGLDDGLVFDAVRIRLVEIGEAVKLISPERLAAEADIPGVRYPACAITSRTATSTRSTASSKPSSTTTSSPSSPPYDGYPAASPTPTTKLTPPNRRSADPRGSALPPAPPS